MKSLLLILCLVLCSCNDNSDVCKINIAQKGKAPYSAISSTEVEYSQCEAYSSSISYIDYHTKESKHLHLLPGDTVTITIMEFLNEPAAECSPNSK